MVKRIEQFETKDGKVFDTEAAAIAHEDIVANYDASLKEVKELLTKAQLMLDTKPELANLKAYLEYNNDVSSTLDSIEEYDGGKDDNFEYYSSNC